MNRREFLKAVPIMAWLATASIPVVGCIVQKKYPPLRVEGGSPIAQRCMVKFNGKWLSTCRWADTGTGEVCVLAVTSRGVAIPEDGDFCERVLRGNVEIWMGDDILEHGDKAREPLVNGPGYLEYYQDIRGEMERIA